MDIERTTVPGAGVLHQCVTDNGQHLGVLVERSGKRRLIVYGSAELDVPSQTIMLDGDEADRIAELLHSRSIADRLATLERRLDALSAAAPPTTTPR